MGKKPGTKGTSHLSLGKSIPNRNEQHKPTFETVQVNLLQTEMNNINQPFHNYNNTCFRWDGINI